MNAQSSEMIDTSAQAAQEWVNELTERIGTGDSRRALRLLRAVLHALRDHLSQDEAAHLAAQLPTLLRGLFYEDWRPSATPVADRGAASFLARVARALGEPADDRVRRDVEEVLGLLGHRISMGEIVEIRRSLQGDFRARWPE